MADIDFNVVFFHQLLGTHFACATVLYPRKPFFFSNASDLLSNPDIFEYILWLYATYIIRQEIFSVKIEWGKKSGCCFAHQFTVTKNSLLSVARHKQTQQHMPEQRSCLQPWPNMEKPVSKTTSSPSSMHSLCVKKGFSYKCIKNLGYICACISLMFALKRLWC